MVYLLAVSFFFFFKQKTAYDMRISDWSSDVCSSDLTRFDPFLQQLVGGLPVNGLVILAAQQRSLANRLFFGVSGWPDATAWCCHPRPLRYTRLPLFVEHGDQCFADT